MTNEKRARAYDHISELIEAAPEATAKALLSAVFNYLSADDFTDMVEREFEWEDPEDDDPDDEDSQAGEAWTGDDGDAWTDEED